jgi:hypothetical protein
MTLQGPIHLEILNNLISISDYIIKYKFFSVAENSFRTNASELKRNAREVRGQWKQLKKLCVERTLFTRNAKELTLLKLCFFCWDLQNAFYKMYKNADIEPTSMAMDAIDMWMPFLGMIMYYVGITQKELIQGFQFGQSKGNSYSARDIEQFFDSIEIISLQKFAQRKRSVELAQNACANSKKYPGIYLMDILKSSISIEDKQFEKMNRVNRCILKNISSANDKIALKNSRSLGKEQEEKYIPSNTIIDITHVNSNETYKIHKFFDENTCNSIETEDIVLSNIYNDIKQASGNDLLFPDPLRPTSFGKTIISVTVDKNGHLMKESSYFLRVIPLVDGNNIAFDTTVDIRSRPLLNQDNLRFSPHS